MRNFLKEREVLGAVIAVVAGFALYFSGDKAEGLSLIIAGVATLGITRGLAKLGSQLPKE